jgi:hypothetical protein
LLARRLETRQRETESAFGIKEKVAAKIVAYSLRPSRQLDQCRPPAMEMNLGPMSTWMWSMPA